MPDFSSYPAADRIKLLLAGDPKVGKTGQLATLANEGYKVRIIDLDNNLAIMNSYLTPEGMANVSFMSFPTKDPTTWAKARAALRTWDDNSKVESWGLDTILVVDSASFLAEAALTSFAGKSKDPRQDYYAAQDAFINEIAYLTGKKVSCHLILIAHFRNQLDKADEVYRTVPAFTGAVLPLEVPKYCNNVWGIFIKPGDKRVIQTQSTNTFPYLGSSAPDKLLATEEFNLGKLFKKATSK